MSKRTRRSSRAVELSIDALTLVVAQLDALDRARFRLVCRRWREAVRARREQLYWYCYRRAWPCLHPECPDQGRCVDGWDMKWGKERLLSMPCRPAVRVSGTQAWVMRVHPVRLALRDADRQFVIVCDAGPWAGEYALTEDRLYHEHGHRPRDRCQLDPDEKDVDDWRHCRLMYLPIKM